MKNKLEAYTIKNVHRSKLNPAPYNPRLIDQHAESKLRDGIEHFGIIEDLVWNEVTGNLVGGHQRLSQLDWLEGHEDYTLDVATVAIKDLKTEKRLNILLNNPEVRGQFDLKKLGAMIQEVGTAHTAFDTIDLQMMGVAANNSVFGAGDASMVTSGNLAAIHKAALDAKKNQPVEPVTEESADPDQPTPPPEEPPKSATPDGTFAAREKAYAEKAAANDREMEFYIVGVFKRPELTRFLAILGEPPTATHVDGEALNARLAKAAAAKEGN